MVVTQLALVLMLLVTSGLLLRSFSRLVAVSPGFDIGGLRRRRKCSSRPSDIHVGAPPADGTARGAVEPRPPAISAVTILGCRVPPAAGSLTMDARPEAEGQTPHHIPSLELPVSTVSPSYFATLGIPIVRGRTFLPGEGEAVVVNTVVARRFWGERSPLGQRFRVDPELALDDRRRRCRRREADGPLDLMGEGMELYSAASGPFGSGSLR